ncbi:MAG: porin family protein, partial [Candidatus Eremiobacteraeota bacterium]|nr:porin family protein [Candidatus Eremiobacteraeota bacterium]
DCGSQFGIGSIQLQNYYAPKTKPNALIYGAGPIFQFPTVTAGFGTNQFGAGLTAVGLVMPGPWVIGDLANNVWRVAGPSAPPPQTLNTFTDQPFINFNFGRGWTLSEAPVMTCNWNALGNQKWTVPVGLALIQTNNWFRQPMSFQLAYYGNVVRPNNAAYGQWRFQWSLLWPILRGRGAR